MSKRKPIRTLLLICLVLLAQILPGITSPVLADEATGTETASGTLSVNASGSTAGSQQTLTLNYTLGETFNNGSLIFQLPTGLNASQGDNVSIGSSPRNLTELEIGNGGQEVCLSGISISTPQAIALTLKDKLLPSAGNYTFLVASADADGPGLAKIMSPVAATAVLTVAAPPNPPPVTVSGSLEISPPYAIGGSIDPQTINLNYSLGEGYVNGSLVFNLPEGFKAEKDTDLITIAGQQPRLLNDTEITNNWQTVTVNGIYGTAIQKVTLTLNNKIMPVQGSYTFSVSGVDADGPGQFRGPGTGAINELTVGGPLPKTASGNMAVYFSGQSGQSQGTMDSSGDICVRYSLGENLNNGTVTFHLPAEFAANFAAGDYISETSSGQPSLRPQEVSTDGRTVIVSANTNSGYALELHMNRILPNAGTYHFSASSDADGSINIKGSSDEIAADFVVNPRSTINGNLSVSPLLGSPGSTKTIELSYRPGETFVNGTLVFDLPSGFRATTDDSFVIGEAASSLIDTTNISNNGQTVTLNNISAAPSQQVILRLQDKVIPVQGTYVFSAAGDADGSVVLRTKETTITQQFVSGTSRIETESGTLAINTNNNFTEGTTGAVLDINYTAGETLINGTLILLLPSEFATNLAYGDYTYHLDPYYGYPADIHYLRAQEISSDGKMITVNGINLPAGQSIYIHLNNRILPTAGSYVFSVNADADGIASAKQPSPDVTITLNTLIRTSGTLSGNLSISPSLGIPGNTKTIELSYITGDTFVDGTLVFELPIGFRATSDDSVMIGDGASHSIDATNISNNGQTVTLTNISATPSQKIALSLQGKVIPVQGTYAFSASGDADGSAALRTKETAVTTQFIGGTPRVETESGTLTINTNNNYTEGTTGAVLDINYTAGETLINGTLILQLPTEFATNLAYGDYTYHLDPYYGYPAVIHYLSAQEISSDGKTITVNGVNLSAGQSIYIHLNNRILPAAGSYVFSVNADADGLASAKQPSQAVTATLNTISLPQVIGAPIYQGAWLNNSGQVITMIFSKPLVNLTGSQEGLKSALSILKDGTTASNLGSEDTAEIQGNTLIITLTTALSGPNNCIKLAGNTLGDGSGHTLNEEILSQPIEIPNTASDYTATPIIQLAVDPTSGSAGIYVGIKDIKDAQGNLIVKKLSGYQLELYYNPERLKVLDIGDTAKSSLFSMDISAQNGTVLAADANDDSMSNYEKLVFIPLAAIGKTTDLTNLTVRLVSLITPELETIEVGTPVLVSFQRGKVLSQDMSNTGLVDAVAALQYLSKLRGAGWEEGEVNVVNMASIILPVADQKTIVPNVKDVIALLQYMVRKRNELFQPM